MTTQELLRRTWTGSQNKACGWIAAIAPMGFAPFPMPLEGKEYFFVWQIVIDDFEGFKAVKEQELGPDVLISAPAISIEL